MTPRTVRRAAAAATLAIASCNVYDSSLLVGGGAGGGMGGGSGNTGGSATAGTEPGDAGADTGGNAGTQTSGGSSGSGGASGGSNGGTESVGGEPPSIGGEAGTGNDGGAGAGTSGSGGSSSGSGGTVGESGSAGTSGSGGNGGSAGSTSATGCAKLSVPLDATGDKSHFLITLTSNQDLTTGTISVRFYVQAGNAGSITPYVQDPNYAFFGRLPAAELSTFSGWSTITWDVGAQTTTGNITKNNIKRVGIEINASPAASGWSNPTVIYIDSITVKTTSFPFETTASVSTTASSSDQGNQVLWFNSGGSDSTATGTLAWQATCP